MVNTNRRKFILIIGSISVGFTQLSYSRKSLALDIDVNRFDKNTDIGIREIDKITIKIKDMVISCNNIDTDKDANLSIKGQIENNNIGTIKEINNINIKESNSVSIKDQVDTNKLYLVLKNGSKYESKYLSKETYKNKENINIKLTFIISHPDLENNITEEIKYKIGILEDGTINFTEPKFNSYKNSSLKSPKNYLRVSDSSSDSSIWGTSDDFKKLEKLASGGPVKNKSDYNIPNGVIDLNSNRFNKSTRDNPDNIYDRDLEPIQPSNKVSDSSSDSSIWDTGDDFKKLEKLASGGPVKNKSDYNIPNGVIDLNSNRFNKSTRDNPDNIYDENLKPPKNESDWHI